MGGRKRSRESSYDEVMKKIRKLEKKVKKKARLPSTSSSTDDDTPQNQMEPSEILGRPLKKTQGTLRATLRPTQRYLRDLLGGDPTPEKIFDENVHKDIAKIWSHILLNGLAKDVRMDLLKRYLPPENCTSMRAPKLNLEIKAALTEINSKKDAYSQSKQNQLGSCLAALGKALNIALASDTSQDLIKLLSDAGRLLCDYHHKESQSRRYAIINTLNQQTKDTIKNTKIDEFLFGTDLAEHIKSSKAITKSGMELRPPPPPPPPPTVGNRQRPKQNVISQPPAVRRGTLNARGAGRAAAAEPRANPAPRRPPTSATTRDQQQQHSSRTATRYQSNRRY
ncbi:uncharacterized protein LOC126381552 [Pectinophora gossypiella]|uniref:uncharacterized protein LOC126381552 n=1 Tax=Pectinophora gossypiella TaxID=13191 RepID=UPI00214EFA82|nr:uncharacterized protein LOC126381552 [Pectinophora gossypiella]